MHSTNRPIRGTVVGAATAALLFFATACSGSSGNSSGIPYGGLIQCNPGAQVQLARPQNQTTASNVGSVEIVVNGNSNALAVSPNSWSLQVQSNGGGQSMMSNGLTAVADPTGYHPFQSDFFYSGNLNQTLPTGYTWTVSLVQGQTSYQSCSPLPLGSFST
ncbi:MAG: hypothetical protein PXZ07_03765 [Candidatus Eremiobacteraeota bacterium]|nr:hypothetical protein [Candidatus Eremiobacteraeota bacterium]